MSLEVAINPNALRMVQQELENTIGNAAAEFEAWLVDNSATEHLQHSAADMAQSGGTFRLLEMQGCALLADNLAAVLQALLNDQVKISDRLLNTITRALFLLPRYLEYVSVRNSEMPLLVLPCVNELRVQSRQAALPEFTFYQGEIAITGMMMRHGDAARIDTLLATMPRFRQMYQTGLIKLMQTEQGDRAAFLLLERPVERIAKLLGDQPQAELWQMAQLVIESMRYGHLSLNFTRKQLLMRLEKMMRQMQSEGKAALQQPLDDSFKRELMFLLSLSSYKHADIDAFRQAYHLPSDLPTDKDISARVAEMQGPSLNTFESVIKELKEELRHCKDILEVASQNASILDEDLQQLLETVKRIADTLMVVNLAGPANMLLQNLEKMQQWQQQPDDVEPAQFLEAADTVLFVESCLSGLQRRQLSLQEVNEASAVTRKAIIASSQLGEAEQIVIEEAQSGIALAKRAIAAYVESNFDGAHIANVSTTLATVRGGLNILGYRRAAELLRHCGDFIAGHSKQQEAAEQHHQLLETLADALISLEYYLYELETNRQADDKILDVAEESLKALGFGD